MYWAIQRAVYCIRWFSKGLRFGGQTDALESSACLRLPGHFISITRQFHDGTMGRIVVGKQESNSIPMNHGTKQGCVLAPTLFTLYLTNVLIILHQQIDDGVYIRSRSDRKLFNLARLRARTKTRTKLITELFFWRWHRTNSTLPGRNAENGQCLLRNN